jgi:flagellar hook-associated protein 3 FlgL
MSRVTQKMLNIQFMRNLNSNLHRMENSQNQLTTGRRINKPSDDPIGISYSMRYRSELVANDQYKENVDSAISWMEQVDTTLNQAGEIVQRIRELTVGAVNDTNDQTARDAVSSEIGQLFDQLVVIANSEFNGKYLFNGQLTDVKPYDTADPMSATPDNGHIMFEIGVGVRISVNVTGDAVFGAADAEDNLFAVVKGLKDSVDISDQAGMQKAIGLLDLRIDQMLVIRADVGAKTNRIELSQERLKDIDVNFTALLAKTEDADLAEVVTQIKMDESIYQAALSTGSRIIQPSLLDYLR